jgi:hypothetical protein
MRFASTSALSLLTVGFAWSIMWGCGNKDPHSTFTGNPDAGPGAGGAGVTTLAGGPHGEAAARDA